MKRSAFKNKPSRVKTLKTKAWQALSKYVRLLEPRCYTCGAVGTQAGHFRHNTDKPSKQLGGNALWYDIRNIHNQCSGCNLFKSGNLTIYAERLEEQYGFGIIQELMNLWNTPKKWTESELETMAEKFEYLYGQYLLKTGN